MSKYDNISSAREMVMYIKMHGLSTKQEDICRVQDIFGRSSVEELIDLANDTGRNNENGEPDPNGSWSSGRAELRGTFYFILFHIWNWEDATRFWNLHTNPDHDELTSLRDEHKHYEKDVCELKSQIEELRKALSECRNEWSEQTARANLAEQMLEQKETEVVKLKAKLYDLLSKEEGSK